MTPRKSLTTTLIAAYALMLPAGAAAEMSFQPRPLERLAPGELAPGDLPQGYSHVVMLAWPRLTAAQAEKTPSTAAKFAQLFGSVILADVRKDPQTGLNRLARVAIGHTMRDGQRVRIVTPESDGLSFIANQVLSSGEKELDKIRQIARYATAVLFESPAVIARNGGHQELKVRHFVWTSAEQGGLASVVWLVDDSGPAGPKVVDDRLVQLPSNFTDDRQLSVDPSQFSFIGSPGKTAFAMIQLPAGTPFIASAELARLAAAPRYDETTLPQLARALAEAVAALP